MKTSLVALFAIICVGVVNVAQAADSPPKSALVIKPCDSGVHHQFEKVTCQIPLSNTGNVPITVSKGEAKFAWDSIDQHEITIAPHATAYINATVDIRDSVGAGARAFRFWSSEAGGGYRGSEVRFFALSVLDDPSRELKFGVVRLDEKLPRQTVTLKSRAVADFRIEKVLHAPSWLDVRIGPDHQTVTAQVLPSAPWGPAQEQYVKLKVNTPKQPKVWLKVDFTGIGQVAASSNPFYLGLMRTNATHQYLIRVTDRGNKPLKFGDMRLEGIKGTVAEQPCAAPKESCRLVVLNVSNDQPGGRLYGSIFVDLPDFHRTMPIRVTGLLLDPSVKIHDFNELVNAQRKTHGGKSAVQTTDLNLDAALSSMVKPKLVAPPGNGPLLRWSADYQSAVYGYQIYRADKESGPFVRVNDKIISVDSNGKDHTGTYQWRDDSAVSGRSYWYIIGVINRDGSKEDLSKPHKAVAR